MRRCYEHTQILNIISFFVVQSTTPSDHACNFGRSIDLARGENCGEITALGAR
jgi:hypothetical protein